MDEESKRHGFLAIWCDIGAADLADYRNWLTREHIADRTFLAGFRGARLFTKPDDETSHFILYATDDRHVLASPPYLAALDNPSPWTRRIMPKFGPFDRAAGEQAIKLGNGYGGFVAVSRVATHGADVDPSMLEAPLRQFLDIPGVVSVRLMNVDRASTDIESREKTMRQGAEGDFRHLLCIEATSEPAADSAAERMAASLPEVFTGLVHFDVSVRRMIYGEAPFEAPTAR